MPSFLKIQNLLRPDALAASHLMPTVLLCVLLTLQVSLFKAEGYMGLRMNAADFLLPVLGLFILARIVLKKDKWPRWRVPHFYAVLAALTALMTFALFNGYATTGAWDNWAIVNKYAGWFILLAYLGVGGWIGERPYQEWLPVIMRVFAVIWALTYIGFCLLILFYDLNKNVEALLKYYPLGGFMGNRNAFAFLSFSMLSIITAFQMRQTTMPQWYFYLIWAFAPLFFMYNASRSILFIIPFIIAAFLILKPRFTLQRVVLPLLIGTGLVFLLFSFFDSNPAKTTKWHTQNAANVIKITDDIHDQELRDELYVGDQTRSKTYGDAWAVFLEHPIIGGGLGSYRHYQTETRGAFIDVVDSTPLWLLAETGFVGLVMFVGLFMAALWRLFQLIRSGKDPGGIFLGIFMMMMIFAIMSLVHELLYTRFMWFFMGLALALPETERKAA